MATAKGGLVQAKEGDPTPAAGDWNTYQPGYSPYTPGNNPVPMGETPPAQGLLGRWQLPQFNSQFQYPQGLIAQLAQSQQPMQHLGPGAFPRYNFGQQAQGIPPPGLPQRQPQMGMSQGLPGLLGQIAQMMAAKTGAK